MSAPILDFDLIREMKNAFNHRLRLVAHAREYGLKNAAADAVEKYRVK